MTSILVLMLQFWSLVSLSTSSPEVINTIENLYRNSPGQAFVAADFNGVLTADKIRDNDDRMANIRNKVVAPLVKSGQIKLMVVSSKPLDQTREFFRECPQVKLSAEHGMQLYHPNQPRYPTGITPGEADRFIQNVEQNANLLGLGQRKEETYKHYFSASFQIGQHQKHATVLRDVQDYLDRLNKSYKFHEALRFVAEYNAEKKTILLYSKGRSKSNGLNEILKAEKYAFKMSIGDKEADMDMHNAMLSNGGICVTVGQNVKSPLCYHLDSVDEVHELFKRLAALSQRNLSH